MLTALHRAAAFVKLSDSLSKSNSRKFEGLSAAQICQKRTNAHPHSALDRLLKRVEDLCLTQLCFLFETHPELFACHSFLGIWAFLRPSFSPERLNQS